MHDHHDIFVQGIAETKKIALTFFEDESQSDVVRVYVPVG